MRHESCAQVYLNGQRLPINCFKDYVDLYVKDKEAPRVHERVNDRWEICICASEGQFQQVRRHRLYNQVILRPAKSWIGCTWHTENQLTCAICLFDQARHTCSF